MAVGFCTSSAAQLIDFPGWSPKPVAPNIQTWAYHGDDGFFCASDRKKWPQAFGQHYGPGDTVGCGLEMDAKEIFFTRNGVKIGKCPNTGFALFLKFLLFLTLVSLTLLFNPMYYLCDLSDLPVPVVDTFRSPHLRRLQRPCLSCLRAQG